MRLRPRAIPLVACTVIAFLSTATAAQGALPFQVLGQHKTEDHRNVYSTGTASYLYINSKNWAGGEGHLVSIYARNDALGTYGTGVELGWWWKDSMPAAGGPTPFTARLDPDTGAAPPHFFDGYDLPNIDLSVGTYTAFEVVRYSSPSDWWGLRINGQSTGIHWENTEMTWGFAYMGAERDYNQANLAWGKHMKFRPTDLSAYQHWSNVDINPGDDNDPYYAMYDFLTPTYDYLIKVAEQ